MTRINNNYILHNNLNDESGERPLIMYASDAKIIEDDNMYIDYIRGDFNAIVLEDIDNHLKCRMEGNNTMYKLLNASDGFIKTSNHKKIILTTNLPNTSDIDPALLREGRCFDVLKFRKLFSDEAIILLKKFECPQSLVDEKIKKENEYTLAELYEIKNNYELDIIKKNGTKEKLFGRIGF